MSKPFDATLKDLIRDHAEDWFRAFVGEPPGPVAVQNTDLSSVTSAADFFLVAGDWAYVFDVESGPNPLLPRRTLRYNVLAHDLTDGRPVRSLVILLRPRADRGDLTDVHEYETIPGRGRLRFEFDIIRLWQVPAERLLAGGIGVVPLAVLGQPPPGQTVEEAMSAVIDGVVRRLEAELPDPAVNDMLTSTVILTGLRLPKAVVTRLFEGVRKMRDSSGYQMILDEEAVAARQKDILQLGRKRFGEPAPGVVERLRGLTDPDRLERVIGNVLDANDWEELLATP